MIHTDTNGTAHLYLYGDIAPEAARAEYGAGGKGMVSSVEVAQDLATIRATLQASRLLVHINSDGGNVMEGWAIANLLGQFEGTVDVIIEGACASIATVIALSVNGKVSMARNAMFLIHNSHVGQGGNADYLRGVITTLDSIDEKAVALYVRRTGKREGTIRSLMAEERWLTAEEALAYKLIDKIVDPVAARAAAKAGAAPSASLYNLAAPTQAVPPPAAGGAGGGASKTPVTPSKPMTFKNFAKMLGLSNPSDDTPEADVLLALAALQKEADELKAKNKELETQLAATKAAAEAQATEAVVEEIAAAVKDGRLTVAESEDWKAQAKANPGFAKLALAKLTPKTSVADAIKAQAAKSAAAGGANAAGREAWTFADWSKKDSAGLERMHKEQPEAYAALREAYLKN